MELLEAKYTTGAKRSIPNGATKYTKYGELGHF